MKEESEKQEKAQWGQQVSSVAENMRAVEKSEEAMRKEIERARLDFNEAKASEAKKDKGFDENRRQQIEEAEMEFHAEDAFLNEYPGRLGLNGNVPRTDRKGDDGRLEKEVFKFNQRRAGSTSEEENEARRVLQQDRAQMNAVNRALKLNELSEQR